MLRSIITIDLSDDKTCSVVRLVSTERSPRFHVLAPPSTSGILEMMLSSLGTKPMIDLLPKPRNIEFNLEPISSGCSFAKCLARVFPIKPNASHCQYRRLMVVPGFRLHTFEHSQVAIQGHIGLVNGHYRLFRKLGYPGK